jgi:cyclopropane fatty-acyl-phospholipid synthase-like methyltransferase
MGGGADELRERVRRTYGRIAEAPAGEHPFAVGRGLAERAGYPAAWLDAAPRIAVEAFAGVSCLPCFAEIGPGARVLDAGCGVGLDLVLVAPRAERVVGVDFSREMVERARTTITAAGASNVELALADAETMAERVGPVDVALVNGIFNLNPRRSEIFRELAAAVRPGGAVYAAELVLKGPLPAGVEATEADWFA